MDLWRRFLSALLNPSSTDHQTWKVALSQDWNVLGPFPIHAREQHYLSPSFPLNLSEPIDFNKSWPSSYADGGRVAWGTAKADMNGLLKVSFSDVRWESLRATEGWAALQHHAVLRTSLTIYPPASASELALVPYLLIHLSQGSYFTVLPSADSIERSSWVPEWYSGNIYDMERALPQIVKLPVLPSLTRPTKYDIYVSGDYEIRLFGDPKTQGKETPVQTIRFSVQVQVPASQYIREPSQDVICDFIDGIAFGDALGIGIRCISGWWTVIDVAAKNAEVIKLSLRRKCRIAPSQMRIVPLHISQSAPFHDSELHVEVTMVSEGMSKVVAFLIPIRNLALRNASAIRATYFYGQFMPTAFIAIPPSSLHVEQSHPIFLALHGAGVDIFEQHFWRDSLPRNKYNWVVVPSGRTSWGLDWHGPSAKDAWSTVDALASISTRNDTWHSLRVSPTKVIILGHSNGGQGAWYLASRYPDRVLGVVPAAGYIKSQAYVPLTMSRSAHFLDPILRAILESSLTPDDNDLYLSNLVDTPVLAIHGGDDENVPVWHSREAMSILRTWSPDVHATFHEDAKKGHWYPSILNNGRVQRFLDSVIDIRCLESNVMEFTLTVSIPSESGSLRGWKIESLSIPGRLGRIRIRIVHGAPVSVATFNVHTFSVDRRFYDGDLVDVDNSPTIALPQVDVVFFLKTAMGPKNWQVVSDVRQEIQPPSRLQQILASCGPIVFIVTDVAQSRELSVALRIIHDLNVYHRLDAEIVLESEALPLLGAGSWPDGNIVFIGKHSSDLVRRVLRKRRTLFEVTTTSGLRLHDQNLANDCSALFLHPHLSSTADEQSIMLFMISPDRPGFERLARLFPIRTGVSVPSWVVLDADSDYIGAAGINGAGVWGRNWKWNEALSWLF